MTFCHCVAIDCKQGDHTQESPQRWQQSVLLTWSTTVAHLIPSLMKFFALMNWKCDIHVSADRIPLHSNIEVIPFIGGCFFLHLDCDEFGCETLYYMDNERVNCDLLVSVLEWLAFGEHNHPKEGSVLVSIIFSFAGCISWKISVIEKAIIKINQLSIQRCFSLEYLKFGVCTISWVLIICLGQKLKSFCLFHSTHHWPVKNSRLYSSLSLFHLSFSFNCYFMHFM